MTAAAVLERATAPLDRVRRALMRVMLPMPFVGTALGKRDSRVALWAGAHALVAFTLASTVPMLLFILGPVLLGVAHVAADIRYLVIRRQLPGWWKNVVWLGCGTLLLVRIADEAGVHALMTEQLLVCGWMALALLAGAWSGGGRGRAAAALPVLGALAWVTVVDPRMVRLVFVHVHNLVAVVLWLALFRSRLRSVLVPLTLMAAATAFFFTAQPFHWAQATGGLQAFGLHLLVAADWVAPGLSPKNAVGLTMAYVFLQSVHYSAWLLLIPQEDLRSEGTTTFRMSARSLLADFGTKGVVAIALTAIAVIAFAFVNVHKTRSMYLSLAMFHGYLELTLLCYFWARGKRPAGERRQLARA
ncbi:MAG: hypothetical protein KC776_40490 [Myxococcales bacterium]|nr:hypothetical protein [Myxococcales bacterium]MCB9581879.1 hypothetical protein [Polyangiaceae bacterium]